MPRTRLLQEWFVRCPQDDPKLDASWQFSMHPHIYHVCKTCGANVHDEHSQQRLHTLRRAKARCYSAASIGPTLDDMIAHPTKYLEPADA